MGDKMKTQENKGRELDSRIENGLKIQDLDNKNAWIKSDKNIISIKNMR